MPADRFFRPIFDELQAPAELRDVVLTELARSERRWHGLVHHALMLRHVSGADVPAGARRPLLWAVLFHDIVYDATRADNEEASAAVARRWLSGAEADAVAALILATQSHDLATADPVMRALLEADLSVLWTASAGLYRFYAHGIRAEYGHVPDPAYRSGRRAVLDGLEQRIRPQIDGERAIRLARNLDWERARLESGSFDVTVQATD